MIPHVNRQEVYGGKKMETSIYDERHYGYQSADIQKEQINASPVDFFEDSSDIPMKKHFPLYQYATKNYAWLGRGDCMFMPAFYYYQVKGFNLSKVNGTN